MSHIITLDGKASIVKGMVHGTILSLDTRHSAMLAHSAAITGGSTDGLALLGVATAFFVLGCSTITGSGRGGVYARGLASEYFDQASVTGCEGEGITLQDVLWASFHPTALAGCQARPLSSMDRNARSMTSGHEMWGKF